MTQAVAFGLDDLGDLGVSKEGWTAFLFELTYPDAFPLKVTSAVRVLPDILPYGNVDPVKTPLETRPVEKK